MTKRKPRRDEQLSRTIVVPNDVLEALQPAADLRAISVNKLCRTILAEVADENLTDAILDD